MNGTSGYVPPAYGALAAAIRERDDGVLDALATTGRMLVAVNAETDPDHFWRADLAIRPRTTHLSDDNGWSLFTIAPPPIAPVCQAGSLPVGGATSWRRPAQRAGDAVVLDLGRVAKPCAVVMSLGPAVYAFPRRLSVATSTDGLEWTTAFNGSVASETVRAAMEQPTDARLQFSLPEGAARFIRVQLEASQPAVPWLVADIVVRGTN